MALSVAMGSPSVVYTLPVRVSDRGDILVIADYDKTALVSYAYDAYGNPVATKVNSSASVPLAVAQKIADLQPLRYAGYAYDSFSGLYYCSARYYDPATCQFISADPALSNAEASAYQYCSGDPVGSTDPSGLNTTPLGHYWGWQPYKYHRLTAAEAKNMRDEDTTKDHIYWTLNYALANLDAAAGTLTGIGLLLFHRNLDWSTGDILSWSHATLYVRRVGACHGKSHYAYWRLALCRNGHYHATVKKWFGQINAHGAGDVKWHTGAARWK